jgi:hypothetical protein
MFPLLVAAESAAMAHGFHEGGHIRVWEEWEGLGVRMS